MDLTTLSADARAGAEALLRDSLMSAFPELDSSPGTAINELLTIPGGAVAAYLYDLAARLAADLDISTSSNQTLLKALLGNFKLKADEGSPGSGLVRFVFDGSAQAVVPAGTLLKTGSTLLKVGGTYCGVLDFAAMGLSETGIYRELAEEPGGWAMYVPASTVGAQYDPIAPGQALEPLVDMATLVRAEAAVSFTGGRPAETVDGLRAKWAESVTMPAVCSGASIKALMRAAAMPALDVSVAGAGSRESWRGASVFGIAPGGIVDVYSRTCAVPSTEFFSVRASPVAGAAGVWSAVLDKGLMPGFYRVETITQGMATYGRSAIVDEAWTADMSGAALVKAGSNPAHFRFSAFQKGFVRFEFPEAEAAADGTALFSFELSGMPGILGHQALLDDPDASFPGLDALVRAPIPVIVSVDLKLHPAASGGAPDRGAVAAAVAAAVNSVPMGRGWLSSADVAVAAAGAAPGCAVMLPIALDSLTLGQDGSERAARSFDMLRIVEDLPAGVTARTACFVCSPGSVSVSIG